MKIVYTTLEELSIFLWLGFFVTSCILAIKIPFWGFLPIIILLGGFLGFLFLSGEIVDKGYEFVWEDIEITKKGIKKKK